MIVRSCPNCSSDFEVQKKSDKKMYCSKSCAAKTNNPKRKKPKPPCLNCGKEVSSNIAKYCSNKCQGQYSWSLKKLTDPNTWDARTLRKWALEKFNSTCQKCFLDTWLDQPITVEVEHMDGNSQNNQFENLTLLCPNCHSQTSTYKGRNKGNGRWKRRIRYQEGKSW